MLHHFPELNSNEDLAREILGMTEFAVEYGYFGSYRVIEWSGHINPHTLNWEQFLIKTG